MKPTDSSNIDNLEGALNQIQARGRRNRLISIYSLVVVFIAGFAWMVISYSVVNDLNKRIATKKDSLKALDVELKYSIRRTDSIHLLKVIDNGFDTGLRNNKAIVKNSFLADSVYYLLLKTGKIDSGLAIQYFNKSKDQNKVWSSLKLLGYKDVIDKATINGHLQNKPTNAIYVFNDVKLYDLKLLALMLIRSGATINTVQLDPHKAGRTPVSYNLVQIGSKAFTDDKDHFKAPPLTVEKIQNATRVQDLVLNPE